MTAAEIMVNMITYSEGNLHDINHFLKVYAYAKTIGEQEKLSEQQQLILEISAILHDIACPLCRKKYGNTNGKYQEQEGEVLAREFLKDTNLTPEIIDRVVFLVAHHHTYTNIDGIDYQILLEADYLVNADESSYTQDNIRNTMKEIFRTGTGITLLREIYRLD